MDMLSQLPLSVLLGVISLGIVSCSSDDKDLPISDSTSDVSVQMDATPPIEIADSGSADTDWDVADGTEVAPLNLTERLSTGQVRAGIVRESSALISGPRAEGRIGDIKIYNSNVAFIIEAPGRAHGGYRFYGGSVIDSDVVRELGDTRGGDFFNETIMSWDLGLFHPSAVEVVSNGTDGSAVVRFTGTCERFHFADSFLQPILNVEPPELDITYEYLLEPDTHYLEHRVTLTNPTNNTVTITWPLTLSNQGDGMTLWMRGYGFDFTDGEVEAMYYVAKHTSHAVYFADAPANVLLDYSDVLAALEPPIIISGNGGTVTRTYQRWVGPGGSAFLESELSPADISLRTIVGSVSIPETTSFQDVWVAVLRDGIPFAIAPVSSTGDIELRLPVGDYQVTAYAPHHAASESVSITEISDEITLKIPAAARIKVNVIDSLGNAVSARVTAIAAEGTVTPYAPHTVRYAMKKGWDWGSWGKVSAVGYATGGETSIFVPEGQYELRISRGLSYTTATELVSVESGGTSTVTAVIDKVVDTTGWMSSDFHIHATRSPDSDTPYDIRALQSVTDEVDLPILTEHVQIGGLQPTLDKLELTGTLGVYGQEVTTFEYGHFNAFPLVEDPSGTNFGAIFPYDKRPAELFEAIRNQHAGDKIIQVNHPRGGSFGAYFDVAKLDLDDAKGSPELWDTNWDAIEVFNGGCNLGEEFDDWIALTNHGLGKTLAGGSDSHGESTPIGMPRTWVEVDRAAVEADREALVAPVRNRHVFVSCGPFVRFTTLDGSVGIGGRTAVDEQGQVNFRVVVSAPAWISLSEARLYRNGEIIDVVPIDITLDGVRLDTEFTDTPNMDAWYMVVVIGSGDLMPVYKSGPPNAFTNPIEVDADGDGQWTAPALGTP